MKIHFTLILIFFSYNFCTCQEIENKDSTFISLPYLSKEKRNAIENKSPEIEFHYGHIMRHTTQGEIELDRILSDSLATSLTHNQKIDLCAKILERNYLYHLHRRSAIQLENTLPQEKLSKYISEDNYGYAFLRTYHYNILYSVGEFRELDSTQQASIIKTLSQERLDLKTRRYLIESLYSLTYSKKSGERIHSAINESDLSKNLKTYNDSLFTVFNKLKPLFVKLDTIHTWMEMDKHKREIKHLLKNPHPIMFNQILSFNPTTVEDSKKLSALKHNALISIISEANNDSFYSTYRLEYLNELLTDGVYSIRFLEKIMTTEERQNLVHELEHNLLMTNNH